MTLEQFNSIHDDFLRGKLSGIPDCCIAFYVAVWSPLVMSSMVHGSNYYFDKWKSEYSPIIGNWGYVPCPLCKVQGNKAQIVRHEPAKSRKKKLAK